MIKTLSRPKSMKDKITHYCPGCGHGIVHRIVCEVLDELNIAGKTIGTAPIGCAVLIYNYMNVDFVEPPHGRSPATATGIKRTNPDKIVFTYQGDGDLAAIGTAEIVHAANRGENITVIFINNAIYGMTGGQMAPTTLIGQKTETTPFGRDLKEAGPPIKISEMLSLCDEVQYIERCAVNTAANVVKTKAAIKKAFENQINNKGFSMVEVLSQCPTNWKMTPADSRKFIEEMMKVYPLGIIKDKGEQE